MPRFDLHQPDFGEFDAETRCVFVATVESFEERGKRVLKEQDRGSDTGPRPAAGHRRHLHLGSLRRTDPAAAPIRGAGGDILDSVFELLVRDVSGHALTLGNKPSITPSQQKTARACLRRRPSCDAERSARSGQPARPQTPTQ